MESLKKVMNDYNTLLGLFASGSLLMFSRYDTIRRLFIRNTNSYGGIISLWGYSMQHDRCSITDDSDRYVVTSLYFFILRHL